MPTIVEKMTRLGNEAVHRAQEENRKLGLPNVYVINGKIIWQMPDGSITDTDPFASDPGLADSIVDGMKTPVSQ